ADVRDALGDLVWDALGTSVRLGIDAELAARDNRVRSAGPLGRAVEDALDRAAEAVKDALLDAGAADDGPAPDPEQLLLPPIPPGRLAAALREDVERTLAAVA